MNKLKVLHTSDWHLGATLLEKRRDAEFELFFDYLIKVINEEEVNILLISGDIFDSSSPSNASLRMYYSFLVRLNNSTKLEHCVIIAGNHDSPSCLDSAKAPLSILNVHIITNPELSEELVVLKDNNDKAEAIIAAVPFLRDKDLRKVELDEALKDSENISALAIEDHFKALDEALLPYKELGIPIIGMAHLFAAGSEVVDGDGVSRLKVGTLSQVRGNALLKNVSYMALGHIHIPQRVNNDDSIRYSGSALAMGFGERLDSKRMYLLSYEDEKLTELKAIPIPSFVRLLCLEGLDTQLLTKLKELPNEPTYLELRFTNTEPLVGFEDACKEAIKDKDKIEILNLVAAGLIKKDQQGLEANVVLTSLKPENVFKKKLEESKYDDAQKDKMYNEFLKLLEEYEVGSL